MTTRKKIAALAVMLILVALPAMTSWAGETLNAVRAKGYVTVGVNGSLFGFGSLFLDLFGLFGGFRFDRLYFLSGLLFSALGCFLHRVCRFLRL